MEQERRIGVRAISPPKDMEFSFITKYVGKIQIPVEMRKALHITRGTYLKVIIQKL